MPAAARVGDKHLCPAAEGPKPHVGGPIVPVGCPSVLIGYMPAARVGDKCTCVGPPDMITKGSSSVLIGNKEAARVRDGTAHKGKIVKGCSSVIIGDSGSGDGDGEAESAKPKKAKGKAGKRAKPVAPKAMAREATSAQAEALKGAAEKGAAACEICSTLAKG